MPLAPVTIAMPIIAPIMRSFPKDLRCSSPAEMVNRSAPTIKMAVHTAVMEFMATEITLLIIIGMVSGPELASIPNPEVVSVPACALGANIPKVIAVINL